MGSTTAKALRYGLCTCNDPHTNHTCLYSSAARHHRPLAGTHCAYPRRDGQAELTWVAGHIPRYMCCTGNWTRIRSPTSVLTGPAQNRSSRSNRTESVSAMGHARSVAVSSTGWNQKQGNFFVHIMFWSELLYKCAERTRLTLADAQHRRAHLSEVATVGCRHFSVYRQLIVN